jgi:hypothetical protein
MRARTIFIIFIVLLVLILVFALWPAVVSMVPPAIAQAFGCETDFNRAIPCVIGGTDWGQTIYEYQLVGYLLLYTVPVGGVALAIWLAAAFVAWLIYLIRRGRTQSS